ncbi:MAG TPA: hypothetical protein VFL82_17075, partial [Thermomicrobiales bacterium]|nr:hypothetical protein [Thermomicrobiales bacterium]
TQRRAVIATIIVVIVVILIGAPLLFLPKLRLEVGYKLHLAPGADATQIFPGDAAGELIVLVEQVPVKLSLPTSRYHAVAIAERTGTAIELHDVNRDRTLSIPLPTYDFIAASADRSALLFVDHESASQLKAVFVNLATGEVRPLPPGQTNPGVPGNWDQDVAGAQIDCSGVSPQSHWVACIVERKAGLSRFVFGDWELRVAPYGNVKKQEPVFRGRGTIPIVGGSNDERWLYAQNETGIWRIPVPAR